MRVCFLDVDGVLNSDTFLIEACRRERVDSMSRWPEGHIDPTCVARLDALVRETGARLVLSSAWRTMITLERLHELLTERGFTGPGFVGRTPKLLSTDMGSLVDRGREVQDWLDVFGMDVTSFVALDDCEFDHLRSRLVLTDGTVGLTDLDVRRAVNVLGRPWRDGRRGAAGRAYVPPHVVSSGSRVLG